MPESFFKKENKKKKVLKKKQKDQKKEDRKSHNNKGKGFDSMIAYVDQNGHLSATPPELPAQAPKIRPAIAPPKPTADSFRKP